MTISDLLEALRVAIASDAALLAWSQAAYGQAPKVVTGLDERNPPPAEEYPICHLYPVRRHGDHNLGADIYAVGLVLGVHDERQTGGGVPEGPAAIDEMTRLVQDAAVAAAAGIQPLSFFMESVHVEYETVEYYPYFLAEMEITLSRPREFE